MKKKICALSVFIIVIPIFLAHALEWRELNSKAGAFSVSMPGTPKLKKKVDHTPIGKVGEDIYELKTKKVTFSAEYSDLPELAVLFGGHHTIYKKANAGFLKNVKGKQLSEKKFKLEGNKGIEVKYETATRVGKVIYLMLHKRLYVMQASVLKPVKDLSVVDKYMKSFRPRLKVRKLKQKN